MLTLSFDTSTAVLSVALLEDGKLLDTFTSTEQKTHSERLMPAIDLLLTRNKKSVTDLDLVVAGNGPGSYTGIRIALSTALGLTSFTETMVLTGSTLQAMAAGRAGETVYAVLDARGGRVFAGGYRDVQIVYHDVQTTAEALAQHLLEQKPASLLLVGNGAPLVAAELDALDLTGEVVYTLEPDRWPDAVYLADIALRRFYETGKGLQPADVRPFYAAPTQAERLQST